MQRVCLVHSLRASLFFHWFIFTFKKPKLVGGSIVKLVTCLMFLQLAGLPGAFAGSRVNQQQISNNNGSEKVCLSVFVYTASCKCIGQ